MKRSARFWSIVLLAVAAIEFGILGASSAGASFMPSWLSAAKSGPPAEPRATCLPGGNPCDPTPAPTPVSPPPCLPDAEHRNDRACDLQPASIQLTPDPLVIHCNGVEHSTLTVRVTDASDRPVADGTTVRFAAYNGTTTPPSSPTHNGIASTSVVFHGDIFQNGPNLIVDVGALEAGIRIRCFPESNQQPPSPPPCQVSPPSSPPCVPPTSTPTPCSRVTSPPSVSPSCPTPTPSPTPFPAPTPRPSIGGEIAFGAPSLVSGVVTVPVLTTAAPYAFDGFSIGVAFDGTQVSPGTFGAGTVLESLSGFTLCAQGIDGGEVVRSCSSTTGFTTSAGTLAVARFTPKASTGCARLHVVTFGPPDGGDLSTGTYTINPATIPQRNTYGTDVTVNLADGSVGCSAPPLIATPTATPNSPSPP